MPRNNLHNMAFDSTANFDESVLSAEHDHAASQTLDRPLDGLDDTVQPVRHRAAATRASVDVHYVQNSFLNYSNPYHHDQGAYTNPSQTSAEHEHLPGQYSLPEANIVQPRTQLYSNAQDHDALRPQPKRRAANTPWRRGHSPSGPLTISTDRQLLTDDKLWSSAQDDGMLDAYHRPASIGENEVQRSESSLQHHAGMPQSGQYATLDTYDLSPDHLEGMGQYFDTNAEPYDTSQDFDWSAVGQGSDYAPWNPLGVTVPDNSQVMTEDDPVDSLSQSSTRPSNSRNPSSPWTLGTTNDWSTDSSLGNNGLEDSAMTIMPPYGEMGMVQRPQGGSDFSFVLVDPDAECISNEGQPNEQASVSADHLNIAGPSSPSGTDVSITSSHVPACLQCTEDGCGREFHGEYRRGNLYRHLRLKHGEKVREYRCEVDGCNKSFQRQDARLKHYRNRHLDLHVSPAQRRPRSRRN
ncbi:hypothetical protein BKA63DRAFT_24887 [Paraphoma chrysanthemicola]|nr:hypothetical protein BKA63DRAFT_24887 [Paraphoma chrysanthemicola]